MAHIAERTCTHYLPMLLGFTTTCCPDPRQVVGYLPEVRPDLVLRRPAHLGEAQGRHRGGDRGRAGRGEQAGHQLGARPRPAQGPARAGRGAGADELEEHAKADELVLSKIRAHARARPARVGQRGRGADAARGDRVLPRASASRSASCGGCPRPPATAPCNPPDEIKIGTVGPAGAGSGDQAGRRRRGADPRPGHHDRLPQPARPDARGDRRRRLAAHRRHRRVRRRRLPEDRRPQEGADHQRGRQEHVAGEHRGEAEGREPA